MCDFTSKPIIVIIGIMNSRRNTARRLEEEVANAGAPPYGHQVPALEENANVDQAPANPLPTEAGMRGIVAQMAQAITTQAQTTTVQAQARKPKSIGRFLPKLINRFLLRLRV